MTQYVDPTPKIAGFKQSIDSDDKTLQVAEVTGIPYGMPVFGYAGNDLSAYLYHDNVATITYDRDFEGSNVIALSVNGVAISAVTYVTSHAATMLLLLAAIEAAITGATATSNTGGSNNVVTITIEDGVDRLVTTTVTGGSNQAVGTMTYSSSMIFEGASRFEQQGEAQISDVENNVLVAGTSLLELASAMAAMIHGDITVVTADAISGKSAAYVVKDGANQGKFTDDTGSSNVALPGVAFTETTTTAGLANVRINK